MWQKKAPWSRQLCKEAIKPLDMSDIATSKEEIKMISWMASYQLLRI